MTPDDRRDQPTEQQGLENLSVNSSRRAGAEPSPATGTRDDGLAGERVQTPQPPVR